MANIPWKYICCDKDRHGTARYYYRAPGKAKIRLRGEPGSEPFALAYFAAHNGQPIQDQTPRKARPHTFRWLVDHYLTSPEFRRLNGKLTQRPRERLLEEICKTIGELPAVIDPKVIRDAVKRRQDRVGAAKEFLAALRAVYKVGLDDELVRTDPTLGIRNKRKKTEGHRTWTAEDCAAFEARWPLGTQARTAYAIGIYTAQRISDAVRLGRPHERSGRLRFTQHKDEATRAVEVDIPIVSPLREALDAWQGKGLTWLETELGLPYQTGKGLQNKFREWRKAAAGVHPRCSFHGLRKAAAARMAEAGCTPHQIMAVLGHSTHQQAATYTAKAQRAGMADDALHSIYAASPVPPQNEGGTKPPKSASKSSAGLPRWQSLGEQQ